MSITEEDRKKKEAIARASMERSRQERRREYYAAGLNPPPPGPLGIITSLPMMLQQGWTIETVDELAGKRVLVSPKKVTV